MTKLQQMKDHLLATRNFDLTPLTPKQQKIFDAYMQADHSFYVVNITLDGAQAIGQIAGYTVMTRLSDLLPYLATKFYKSGFRSHILTAATEEGIRQEILGNMAWGALMRRGNLGLWQRQLPHDSEISPYRNSRTSVDFIR